MGVVAILFASAGVPACRLKVTVGQGANPHVFPGRRYDKQRNPGKHPLVADPLAAGLKVGKRPADLAPLDARRFIVHILQVCSLRRLSRIGRRASESTSDSPSRTWLRRGDRW